MMHGSQNFYKTYIQATEAAHILELSHLYNLYKADFDRPQRHVCSSQFAFALKVSTYIYHVLNNSNRSICRMLFLNQINTFVWNTLSHCSLLRAKTFIYKMTGIKQLKQACLVLLFQGLPWWHTIDIHVAEETLFIKVKLVYRC